jgi:hypothetical protein
VALIITSHLLTGCTTTAKEPMPGMQTEHIGFVPARIAILPCLQWPEASRYKSKPLSNADKATFANLCESLDKFVLSGFSNQPFMKGYSTSFVEKSLSAVGQPDRLDQMPALWAHQGTDCMECSNIASFYRQSIAPRQAWQLWLSETSKLIRNADAMLIPTILYAWERRYNDRGVLVLERSAAAALLVVSTGTGELIWAGARAAVVPVRKLEANLNNQTPNPPEWSLVSERIFTEHLWAEFPGRQVY